MESDRKNQVVRCRPRGYWWLAGFFDFYFAVFLYAYFFEPSAIKDKGDAIAAALLLAMVGVPALSFTLLAWRGEIVGDEKGLRWRRFKDWKSASWSEVTDFYQKNELKKSACYVETGVGNLTFQTGLHSDAEKLAELVATRATNAKYNTWGVRGLRANDNEPVVFRHKIAGTMFFGLLTILCFGGICAWPFILEVTRGGVFKEFGLMLLQFPPLARLIFLVLCGVMWCSIGVFPYIFARMAWSAWQHRREIITVSPEGISWRDGAQNIAAKWDEVTDFHLEKTGLLSRNFWLETAQGGIVFDHSLQGHFFLVRLIDRYAPHLKAGAKSDVTETLGDEKLKWSGQHIGEGARIYHFRTTSNRAVLWIPTGFCLFPLILPVLNSINPETNKIPAVFWWAYGVIIFLVAGICWLYFYRSAFRVTKEGLEKITPLKKQFITWTEIEKLENDSGRYRIYGNKTKISIASYLPADWPELKAEIARRVVNVPEGWQDAQKKSSGNKFADER